MNTLLRIFSGVVALGLGTNLFLSLLDRIQSQTALTDVEFLLIVVKSLVLTLMLAITFGKKD